MELRDWLAIIAICVAIFVPVGLAINAAGRARSERNIKRLDEHIAEDVKAHERVARLEERTDRHEHELERLRNWKHSDLRDETRKDVFQIMAWWKEDVLKSLRRDRDDKE